MGNYKSLLKHVKTFIFDYDGVLTDGTIILLHDSEPLRTANVKDGYALHLAVKNGYRVVIISGGTSNSVYKRFASLNIKDIFLGVENKLKVFQKYVKEHNLDHAEILIMGDDIPDYRVMKEVGVPICPSDAVEEIKTISKYVSHCKCGHGCVRDIIEQVLKIQNKWMKNDAFRW